MDVLMNGSLTSHIVIAPVERQVFKTKDVWNKHNNKHTVA